MKVSFLMRRNPGASNKKPDAVHAKDVRQIDVAIDYEDGTEIDEIVFRRYETSKHKANESTVESITTHLEHFFDYVTKIKKCERTEHLVVNVIYEIDKRLNATIIEKSVLKRLEERMDETVTYRDIEVEIYQEVLEEIFLNNEELIDIMVEYNWKVFRDNMAHDSDVNNKLTSADVFIIHTLILYSKLIYLPYFRLTINVGYIEICKHLVIQLGDKINNRLKEMEAFPLEELQNGFMNRLYGFLLNACVIEFEKHSKNINKFESVGMSKETMAMKRVQTEILSAFTRIGLRKIKDPNDKTSVYGNLKDWDEFGMVTTNTASYIQRTKKEVTNNVVGVIKPAYIIKTLSSEDEGGTEISQTSRFEIQAEKNNKEQYQRMMESKECIMDDIFNKIHHTREGKTKGDYLERLYDSILKTTKDEFRTDLNKFIVSFVLNSKYGVDVSYVLTLKEFVWVCIYANQCLMLRYGKLAHAIMAKAKSGKNAVVITADMFTNRSFLVHDEERVLRHLVKMCSTDYIIISSTGNISEPLDIESDLIRWINDGFPL